MPPPENITSPQNPRVKHVLRLRKHSERDAEGVVLIEGYREIRRAVDNRHRITTLFHSPEHFLGTNEGKPRSSNAAAPPSPRCPTETGPTACSPSPRRSRGNWPT
jgi:TrmH family RNA methyltransferase